MNDFTAQVAKTTGVDPAQIRPLTGGDLSQVLLVACNDGRQLVAKGGPDPAAEAEMLRAIAAAGVPAPEVVDCAGNILLLAHVEHDGSAAWDDLGRQLARLHAVHGESYGWRRDYAFGEVRLENEACDNWPRFWFERRLMPTAMPVAREWRDRVDRLDMRLTEILPAHPPASLLHGDLWSGNFLTSQGKLAALIDPACYYGHSEVDLAMLHLFGSPSGAFSAAYGALEPGWEERRATYQLFPALVHLRLFGEGYSGMVDGLLRRLDV